MKVSENWLREWVQPELSREALLEQLSMAGLEVDDALPVAGDFQGVVVGRVISCAQHPDADKLRVTQVDVGTEMPLDIVCGAPNCREGLWVAVATVGAVLPGGFKIKKAKLRGQPSHGMLCSYSELGIDIDSDGIIELPEHSTIGTDIREYLQLDDVQIDIDLTVNRADCFSVRGLARELGALNEIDVQPVDIDHTEITHHQNIAIDVQAPEACPRYLGQMVCGVDMNRPTPLWMQEKLRRSGIRSLDPVVDVTNYVMLEFGQPMHAFDAAKIDQKIIVRQAKEGESLTLLDGQDVTLNPQTLVISDQHQPLAIAGIFGGQSSSVSKETKNVFLECAFFAPDAIRGRARHYGLHTESSLRFERGVDSQLQHQALARAVQLLVEICGGARFTLTGRNKWLEL